MFENLQLYNRKLQFQKQRSCSFNEYDRPELEKHLITKSNKI